MATGGPGLIGRAARRFDRLLGRAVYRTVLRAADRPALCARLEAAVRAEYEPAGFEVRVDPNPLCWNVDVVRGWTAGFGVTLVPRTHADGTTDLLFGVVRTSRLDGYSRWVAAAFGLLAFVGITLAVGAVNVPLPGPLLVVVVLGVTVATLLAVYQLMIPAVALVEYGGGGRLDREATAAVVGLVRATVEATPGAEEPAASGTSA